MKADFKKRLAALSQLYRPAPEPITISFSVINVVGETDPRLDSWVEENRDIPGVNRSTVFHCRDLAHFDDLVARYHAEQENMLLFHTLEPKGPISLTLPNDDKE